jgi:hypothetical protein
MSEAFFPPRIFRRVLLETPFLLLGTVLLNGGALAQTPAAPALSAAAPQPVYFFTVELDPRYQLVGTGALTEEDATLANCFRFDNNAIGKPQQLEYRAAGSPIPDPIPSPLLGITRVDFEYQPDIERRWFRDAHGQPIRNVDGIYGEELKLNKAGYPTDITNLDESGGNLRDNNGVIHYVRTLDDHNRVVALRRVGLLGTPITDDYGLFETRTVYDVQGRIMERGNYDASGNPLSNNDGVALIRTTYTLYPDSTLTIESYFDASGIATEEKSTGIHQRQRAVDQRGLLIDEAYFDTTGAPTVTTDDGIHERRFTYDDRGNQLTEEFFDTDGKPCNEKGAGFARVVYKYDNKNRVIEKAYFGDDGAPQVVPSLGAAIIRQSYDKQGTLVRRQFFDGQGQPSAHVKYGVPAIRIAVDGDTTTITLRNGNDRPAKNPVNGYYSFSYKTATDQPLTVHNHYYDRHGQEMSLLRVMVINPHLHLIKTTPVMLWSAYLGAAGAGIGSLLGCWIALHKSSHTKRRKVYVPAPWERFFGWFAVFAILEGTLRFLMTVYWCWIVYENGRMGNGFYVVETIFVLFFLYRFYRMSLTMRVLNIGRDDVDRLIRDFFAKVSLKPDWIESRHHYVTAPLDVRVNYSRQKFHAYLAFASRGPDGHSLAQALAQHIRAQANTIQAPVRSRGIALYYSCVAVAYFLLAGTAFYTLFQVIKGF